MAVMRANIDNKTLADALIYYRKKHNKTQEDVGKMLNRSKTAVATWEQAQSAPSVFLLHELSNIYGVSMNDLIEGVKR